ncbi:MAG: ribosome biogenesis GTP-binding protein YihA/YsxC [bacterium]
MKITHSEFIASYTQIAQLPKLRLPEIAFAGRSNVGKSSLINRLLNRKNLARTSGTPGKTRQLNYILVNNNIHFVDLPGYGFAKVSKEERSRWQQLIEAYMTKNDALKAIVSIIDARHGPSDLDVELLEWLAHINAPALVVVTKVDKLKQSQFAQAKKRITQVIEKLPVGGPIFFSSMTGIGKNELLKSLDHYLES